MEAEDTEWETDADPDRITGTGEPIGVLVDRRNADDPDTEHALPRLQPVPPPPLPAGTALVEEDEGDPDLHDLDNPPKPGYRRAAGE
jgi:hypothetical protein